MKSISILTLSVLLVMPISALAAGPATNAAPLNPDRPKNVGTTFEGKPAAVAPDRTPLFDGSFAMEMPKAVKPVMSLDDYLNELGTKLKLSDSEKASVKSYYVTDGPLMENVLGNASLSPLQQDQQISDLRNARNAKIEELLQEPLRQQEFLAIEAKYRVALLELAGDCGLIPPTAPAPAPAPAAAPTTAPKAP